MKKLIKYPFIIFCILFLNENSASANPDLEIIRKRVINDLMKPEVNEVMIKSLTSSIKEDGSWPNINYEDVSRTGFQHGDHLRNLGDLTPLSPITPERLLLASSYRKNTFNSFTKYEKEGSNFKATWDGVIRQVRFQLNYLRMFMPGRALL